MTITRFDPELLYVECAKCGQPVLWSPGDTTRILAWAGIIHRILLKGGFRSSWRMVQRIGDLKTALRNQNTEGPLGSKERTGETCIKDT